MGFRGWQKYFQEFEKDETNGRKSGIDTSSPHTFVNYPCRNYHKKLTIFLTIIFHSFFSHLKEMYLAMIHFSLTTKITSWKRLGFWLNPRKEQKISSKLTHHFLKLQMRFIWSRSMHLWWYSKEQIYLVLFFCKFRHKSYWSYFPLIGVFFINHWIK